MSYRIVPVIQILDLSIFSAVIITAEHAAPDNMDTQHATDQYHVYCREVIERQQIKKKKKDCSFGIHETRVPEWENRLLKPERIKQCL